MLSYRMKVFLGGVLQRAFPNQLTRQCQIALDEFGSKARHHDEWPYVREIARDAILAQRLGSQRNAGIIGPAADALLAVVVAVSMELAEPCPRYQTFAGPAQLESLDLKKHRSITRRKERLRPGYTHVARELATQQKRKRDTGFSYGWSVAIETDSGQNEIRFFIPQTLLKVNSL